MRINMSVKQPMGITAKAPRVRYSAAYPTYAPAPQASGCLSEANPKGRKGPRESVCCCGKRKLLWQFTVAIRCDPVAPAAYLTGRERIVKVTPLPCGLSTMVLLYQ